MSDKILAKYAPKSGATSATIGGPGDSDIVDDFGAFGWLLDPRARAVMLELRKATGDILAVGYSWLERALFNPSEGITLHLVGQPIHIRGRNLNAEVRPQVRLFQGITRHRVTFIHEAGESTVLQSGKGVTVVEAIEW